jgi:ArsR family transcriptional regulator, arsenate/arsenite/antimonite-responsive transcriptional repressor
MKTKPANRVDLAFRAVADPTRLRILNLLGGGERCVCELVGSLGCPQPKASRHLAYLRRAGLVSVRKEGLWAYYRLSPARDAFHAKLLECLASCFGDVPVMKRDKKRLQQNARCC